ncbi:MAG: 50S ribosomal protein L1 [Candidatus Marinimicrobia bacterium]|jgi:large subunit ribosomal protein L1|nr:50S ribosomal protein L1 [Candidatus Neomarinimicrobiota bacterium]MBT3796604.1 50S ribosomal protein L1 [Candidatus Neomarinimicrobiota bacterium]MBT4149858.1 50S ribosomal protein L1 [Candidatus Neomarinimicrobiota bacterium]MBT4318420.1 50S ribosomal protein L1 [Candidatus Neomarinimicrobiota bacterium]MBT4785341.1 50S ribosomal protein L1 [Candidatus Neomarinimicrobiota bacterium]|tara:strand:+ start:331 stop:1017 length:687 start_codon:yes stop_codon:yes gene_type:complete
MGISKNKKELNKKIDSMKNYSLKDAVKLVKESKFVKFDESIDLAINLGVDPRHADQNIRLTTTLPHGTGKDVKVLVITQGPKEKDAQEAGADYVGKEYLEKLKNGWDDVDKVVATPDMMPELGKLGKILGPKGLMPNPKSGTVTMDITSAVKELKAGKIEIRVEKTGIVHIQCGKSSFEENALLENIQTIYDTIMKAKPSSVKGTYFKKISMSSSMGPGIKIDQGTIR